MKKYHLTHAVTPHPGGLTKEDLAARAARSGVEEGACDDIILFSILRDSTGASSTAIVSLNGETGKPLDDSALFLAWSLLAYRLSKSKTLGPNGRELAKEVFAIIKRGILSTREPLA